MGFRSKYHIGSIGVVKQAYMAYKLCLNIKAEGEFILFILVNNVICIKYVTYVRVHHRWFRYTSWWLDHKTGWGSGTRKVGIILDWQQTPAAAALGSDHINIFWCLTSIISLCHSSLNMSDIRWNYQVNHVWHHLIHDWSVWYFWCNSVS